MKLKKIKLKSLKLLGIILILVLAVLAVIFFKKTNFVKFNQQPTQTATSTEPALIDSDFAPRDPNLNNEQNLIKDYLAAHLSKLSPTKEVLGGKFQLTDIKFPTTKQAIISYEDGHIALQAEVNYELTPQELKITNFKIIKEN